MSLGSFLKGAVKGIVNVASDFIPGGSLIKAGVDLLLPEAKHNFPVAKSSSGGGNMLPAVIGAGSTALTTFGGSQIALPSLAAAGVAATTAAGVAGGNLPWWQGPGGKAQMPWNDPRIPDYLKQFALDDAYLKPYYRAPKGYVVLKDSQGRPFAVNKAMARAMGLWKPSAKPPISATDYKHFKRNKTIEKKLKKIAGPLLRKHTTRTATTSKRR